MSSDIDLQKLKATLLKLGLITSEPQGCSEEEIAKLADYLPLKYQEFLKIFGKNVSGRFMGNYYFTDKYLPKIQGEGQKILKKHTQATNVFFFATFDYIDFYFFTIGNDNPPVFICSEKRAPIELFSSFTNFLASEMGEIVIS